MTTYIQDRAINPSNNKACEIQTYWLSSPLSKEMQDLLDNKAIDLALMEDLGTDFSDLTTDATIPANKYISAAVLYKQKSVIAGLNIFVRVFQKVDPKVTISILKNDGNKLDVVPETVAIVKGPAASILKAERTALNFLQRLSGIATITRNFVQKAAWHNIAILDTRKTTPGLRVFEKYATAVGGAINHRFGLFDGIMIKDNHIAACGSIASACAKVKETYPDKAIEVETKTLSEVQEALEQKASIIMLDNMSPEMVREAVALINGRSLIEVSGGITLDTIDNYLIRGVNAISVGALTHSACNIDISLEGGD